MASLALRLVVSDGGSGSGAAVTAGSVYKKPQPILTPHG